MNFKKILKTLAISSIFLITLLMIVVSPVAGMASHIDMKRIPVEDLKPFPGDITPDVDETAPVTRIKAYPYWTNEDVTVHLRAYDADSGVAATYYNIQKYKESKSSDLGSQLLFQEGTEFTVTKEGIYKITYYSVDKEGNKEAEKSTKVYIDKSKPDFKFRMPSGTYDEKFVLPITAVDALSGVEEVFYSIDSKAFVSGDEITFDKDGTHTVEVYVVDKAGNEADHITFEVKMDLDSGDTGGSSGGTSSSGSYIPPYEGTTYVLTEAQLKIGYTLSLYQKDQIKFFVEDTEYSVLMKDVISTDGAIMTVFGTDMEFAESETKMFDIDADGVDDIKLTMGNAYYTSGIVTIKSLAQPAQEDEDSEDIEDNTSDDDEESENVIEDVSLFGKITGAVTEASIPVKIGFVSFVFIAMLIIALFIVFKK